MKRASWVTFGALVLIGGLVVYSSLRIGGVRCEVCLEFGGRRACRAVDGDSEAEARQAAVTNACALVASGVTDTMACERTPPTTVTCAAR